MALFAYTVDWDNDLSTLYDRDIFVQTYDFASDSFTHIIRISPDSGCYCDPELDDSDNTAYLFYGAKSDENDDSTIQASNGTATAGASFTVNSAKTADGGMSLYVSLLGLSAMLGAALATQRKRRQRG